MQNFYKRYVITDLRRNAAPAGLLKNGFSSVFQLYSCRYNGKKLILVSPAECTSAHESTCCDSYPVCVRIYFVNDMWTYVTIMYYINTRRSRCTCGSVSQHKLANNWRMDISGHINSTSCTVIHMQSNKFTGTSVRLVRLLLCAVSSSDYNCHVSYCILQNITNPKRYFFNFNFNSIFSNAIGKNWQFSVTRVAIDHTKRIKVLFWCY